MAQVPLQPDTTAQQLPTPALEAQPTVAVTVPERPLRAPQVQLCGELSETGFTAKLWLVQRDDKFLQLTEVLYYILEQANGQHTLDEIAAGVAATMGRRVSAASVGQLIGSKLIPKGLVVKVDGTVEGAGKVVRAPVGALRSPLAVNLRQRVISAQRIEPVARLLQFLFTPPILVAMLLLAAVSHAWVYLGHGVDPAVQAVLTTPGLLLVLLALTLSSAAFHEFGHAAALRYGGSQARGIGIGFYLLYPVFYTDVTDSYRLGRWARVRTDLGGIYFNLIFELGLLAFYLLTGHEFLVFAVLMIDLQIFQQMLPFVRFDGYWALADLTGIPDFFALMGPFIRSMVPVSWWPGPSLSHLKRWVRVVFGLYLLVTVPLLIYLLVQMVRGMPSTLAAVSQAMLQQTSAFATAKGTGDLLGMVVSALQLGMLAVSMFGLLFVLVVLGYRALRALWTWSKPTPLRRLGGVLALAMTSVLLVFLWAPHRSLAVPIRIDGLRSFKITERLHVPGRVSYPQVPPVGGNHAAIWQNCGFYNAPVANENAVHSLEHGAVWITYRPDLPKEQVDSLRQLAQRQSYVLVSPYPGLPAPVVASAWGYQLRLDSAHDPRLGQFVSTFRAGGVQSPEAGGPCSHGLGTPAVGLPVDSAAGKPSPAVASATPTLTPSTRPTAAPAATSQLRQAMMPSPTATTEPATVPTSVATATPERTSLPSTATSVPAGVRVYIVKRSDTLRTIAARFNVSVAALLRANGLSPAQGDRLQPDQQLTIPPPG